MLSQERWISLKMGPIIIAIDFPLFSKSAYDKFVEILIEAFIKFFLVLEFSLPSEL